MKIIICIQSSNVEPYNTNTQHLINSYKRIIYKKNFPIKSFFFRSNGTTNLYFNKNEISLPYDDHELHIKQINLYNALLNTDWLDFDVFVQTNASTILNIEKLYNFLINKYESENFYCGAINNFWHVKNDFQYPNGNLCIYSKEILKTLYDNWFTAIDSLKEIYGDSIFVNVNNGLHWSGIAEDFIIGYIINNTNIKTICLEDVLNFRSTLYDNVDFLKSNIYDYIAMFAKTYNDNIEIRKDIEPNIIELFSLIFEKHTLCN